MQRRRSPHRQSRTKAQLVTDELRERIIVGDYEPGEHVRQDQLATDLHVSTTPIREALRVLQIQGYVTHSDHQGVRITHFKDEILHDIYTMRKLVERIVIKHALKRINSDDIERLWELEHLFERAVEAGDKRGARLYNYRFHRYVHEACGHPELLSMVTTVWSQFPWFLLEAVPGRGEASVSEHRDFLNAVTNEETEQALKLVEDHIEGSYRDYVEHLRETEALAKKEGGSRDGRG